MPRAVLKDGLIYPLDPLPAEWADGKELWVGETNGDVLAPDADDKWFEELEALVQEIDPQDIERLEAALKEADEQAKMMMRREMGLPWHGVT